MSSNDVWWQGMCISLVSFVVELLPPNKWWRQTSWYPFLWMPRCFVFLLFAGMLPPFPHNLAAFAITAHTCSNLLAIFRLAITFPLFFSSSCLRYTRLRHTCTSTVYGIADAALNCASKCHNSMCSSPCSRIGWFIADHIAHFAFVVWSIVCNVIILYGLAHGFLMFCTYMFRVEKSPAHRFFYSLCLFSFYRLAIDLFERHLKS